MRIERWRLFHLLVIGVVLFVHTSKAVAAGNNLSSWTLYVFGYGDIVQVILGGVASLVRSSLFSGLVHIIILIGLAGMLLANVMRAGLSLLGTTRYLVLTALIVRLLTGFYINISLIDVVQPKNNQLIAQVPLFLGLPAAIFSQVAYRLAAVIDEAYAADTRLPLTLTMTGGQGARVQGVPYGRAVNLLQAATQLDVADPLFKRSLLHFAADCWLPVTAKGRLSTQALMQTDLWHSSAQVGQNPALMTFYYGSVVKRGEPMGVMISCMESYRRLTVDFQAANERWLAQWNQATESVFHQVLNYVFASGRAKKSLSLAGYLRQAALLSIVSNSLPAFLNDRITGLPLDRHPLVKLGASSVRHALLSGLGYFYAVLQVLIYALAPLVLLLLLYPGVRTTVLKIYLQSLAWFPVTLILLTASNDMVLTWLRQKLLAIVPVASGLTLANKALILQAFSEVISVSQWLIALMPLFTWSVLRAINAGAYGLLASVERLYQQKVHSFLLVSKHNQMTSSHHAQAMKHTATPEQTVTTQSSRIMNDGIAAISRRFIHQEDVSNES